MDDIDCAAARFVAARSTAQGLADYPGSVPESLEAAYRVQREAIAGWGDRVVGWKVGRIQPHLVGALGVERFIGPVFAQTVTKAGTTNYFPAFHGGVAVFEAEIMISAAVDAPADKQEWTAQEASALVGTMNVGIEIAGSPLASINELGSLVTIAGFGNNNGLIVGPEIPDWRERDWHNLICAVRIDGEGVAQASAGAVPGGPLEAFAFALGEATRQGRPIRSGDIVSTGAITGMHVVTIGQRCVATFGGIGAIECEVIPALARTHAELQSRLAAQVED